MTWDEQYSILRHLNAGPLKNEEYIRLRNLLVVANLAFIQTFAKRFKYDREDLFQHGVIGFMKGIDTYDIHMVPPHKLQSWAGWWILSAIQKGVEANRLIKMSRDNQQRAIQIKETAAYYSCSYKQAMVILGYKRPKTHENIFDTLFNTDNLTFDVPKKQTTSTEDLWEALNRLSARDQQYLRWNLEGYTTEEISAKIGKSRSWADACLREARANLKDELLR